MKAREAAAEKGKPESENCFAEIVGKLPYFASPAVFHSFSFSTLKYFLSTLPQLSQNHK